MKHQRPRIGTIVSQDIPQVSTHLASLGFDFIFIDLEHGQVSDNTIVSIINSATDTCLVLARIRSITEAHIKHALDLGCHGIIAPRVETLTEIQTLVDYSYFPPHGKRSVGFSAANQFGLQLETYQHKFKPMLLAQIESITGLSLLQDIVSTERIDGVFMGPYDLSMSMGITGQFDHPIFQDAILKIKSSCKEQQKLYGTFAANTVTALEEIEANCDLLAIGIDSNLLLHSYQDILSKSKD